MKQDLAIPNTADLRSLQGWGGWALCCHKGHPPAWRCQLQVQTNLCGRCGMVWVQPCSSTKCLGSMLNCLCLHILFVSNGFHQGLILNTVRPYTGNQILSWDVRCVIPAQNCFWSRDTCTQMQNLNVSFIMNLVISLLFQSVLNYFF